MVEKLKALIGDRFLSKGQVPRITLATDASIMGGLILEIGDKTVDLSVATRVNSLKQSLGV